MLGRLLVRAQCAIGIHSVEWQYDKPNSCEALVRCKREGCGFQERKVRHENWGELKKLPGDCRKRQICLRCQEERVALSPSHDWEDWNYVVRDGCVQVRVCRWCGKKEQQMQHIWEPWRYSSEVDCKLVRYCRRCNEVEIDQEERHKWGDWIKDLDSGRRKRSCTHCGIAEWGDLVPEDPKIVTNIYNPAAEEQVFIGVVNPKKS